MELVHEERISKILKILKSINYGPGFRALEIGPGESGTFIRSLPDTIEKYSVDIEHQSFPGVSSKLADMNDRPIPFPDNSFDLIICCEVLEHLWNADNILYEMNKKLRSGGRIVLSTPNLTSLASRFNISLGRYPGNQKSGISLAKSPGGHIKCYNPESLRYLFDLYGLRVEHFSGASSGFFLRRLLEWYPPFSTYMVFVLSKEKEPSLVPDFNKKRS